MEEKQIRKQIKFDYRWIIVIMCFIMEGMALGFCSSNKSLYLGAITEALHIDRALFSINDSCRFITTAIVNLFFGVLVTKFGVKKMIAAGYLSLVGSMLVYIYAENIYVFYIGGALLGLGLAWTTTSVIGYIISSWFKENKGTVMGFVLAANGVFAAVAAQIITPIIYEEGNPFGYRNAYRLVAVMLVVTGILAVLLLKLNPDAEKPVIAKKKAKGNTWSGMTLREAAKKPFTYVAALCIFLTGMCLQGVNGISGTHMKDVGLDTVLVATALSTHSLVLAASKFGIGFCYDRFGLRTTMIICDAAAVVAFLSLGALSPDSGALAMVYGVVSGLALPLETIMLPLIASDLFGEKDFATIMGITVSVNQAGYAVGAPVANLTFDKFGTYQPMLYVTAGLMVVIAIVFQFVISAARKERANIEAQ